MTLPSFSEDYKQQHFHWIAQQPTCEGGGDECPHRERHIEPNKGILDKLDFSTKKRKQRPGSRYLAHKNCLKIYLQYIVCCNFVYQFFKLKHHIEIMMNYLHDPNDAANKSL